jgi:hypothetical protein
VEIRTVIAIGLAAPKRRWSWATASNGSGIWPRSHFPGAIQIVDLFHARQHLWELARLPYPNDVKGRNAWIGLHQKRWLDRGKIATLVASLRSIQTPDADLAQKIRHEANYFATNAARMNYPRFRTQHLFVGSAVIEASCKTVTRPTPQTIRHVLDRAGRKLHPGAPLLPSQRPLRELLGIPVRRVISTSMSRTRPVCAVWCLRALPL